MTLSSDAREIRAGCGHRIAYRVFHEACIRERPYKRLAEDAAALLGEGLFFHRLVKNINSPGGKIFRTSAPLLASNNERTHRAAVRDIERNLRRTFIHADYPGLVTNNLVIISIRD